MNQPIVNFGGNVRFTPRHFYSPANEEEVLAILDRHARGKIRVVGALHAWSPAVVCEDVIVDMSRFDSVAIDRDADGTTRAIVGGGCPIKQVLTKLHALADVTIPSLGLVTEQTIAGSISTATHGSGKHSLSHYMDEFRIAAFDAATGKARVYVWNSGVELRAARCALGCMGIILSVKFRCVPNYEVAETIVACGSIDEALAGEEQYPLQQFYLVPYRWSFFVQRRCAMPEYRPRRGLAARLYRAWWFLCIDVGLHVSIKLMVSVLKSRTLTRFFYRHVLSKMILKNVTVRDHSERILVMEHELFKHLEIEIFVPTNQVRDAAAFVRDVLQVFDGAAPAPGPNWPFAAALAPIGLLDELARLRGTFTQHYAITFRRVLADDALISMTSDGLPSPPAPLPEGEGGNAWYAISFITYVEPREPFYQLASFLARSMTRLFQARLHWGKYFPLNGADIAGTYPRLAEFRAVCRQVDPNGVFRNEFADRVLFDGHE